MKNNKKLQIIFIIILCYSSAFIILIKKDSTLHNDKQEVIRQGYVDIVIQAKSYCSTKEPHKAYQLTNKTKSLIIKNVFIIDKISDEFNEHDQYQVQIPEIMASKVIDHRNLELHCSEIKFKIIAKEKSYEIYY